MAPRALSLLAVGVLLAGCFGGGTSDESFGDVGWEEADRAARRASFELVVPADRVGYRLMMAMSGPDGVSLDLLTPTDGVVSLEEAGTPGYGLLRSLTRGGRELGREQIGGRLWSVYDQPLVGGTLLVHRDRRGGELAIHGDASGSELRSLASLVPLR